MRKHVGVIRGTSLSTFCEGMKAIDECVGTILNTARADKCISISTALNIHSSELAYDLLKLIFSDGSSIICGRDTKFLSIDGKPIKASDAKYSDKLYTLNGSLSVKGFEFVYKPEQVITVDIGNKAFDYIELSNGSFVSIGQ